MVLAGLLLAAAYSGTIIGIAGTWFESNSDMGHGFLVPPCAAYLVWLKRERLRRIPVNPSAWGLLLVFWAALQYLFGQAAHWVWFSRTAFIFALAGFILTLWGFKTLRELAYPLALLSLMIPPPTFLYEWLTLRLQLAASRLGEVLLDILGVSVLREGNLLEIPGDRMSVEAACSGIRSLLALVFFGAVYNFMFVGQRWIRVAVMMLIIPLAVVGNTARIVATGLVSQYNRAWAHGLLHDGFGYVSLVGAAIGLVVMHTALTLLLTRFRVAAR